MSKFINAFCVSCHENVEGSIKEIVPLESGKHLHRGQCPKCLNEIKRIVPKNNLGSHNGRRAVSETDNVSPIPTPKANE